MPSSNGQCRRCKMPPVRTKLAMAKYLSCRSTERCGSEPGSKARTPFLSRLYVWSDRYLSKFNAELRISCARLVLACHQQCWGRLLAIELGWPEGNRHA